MAKLMSLTDEQASSLEAILQKSSVTISREAFVSSLTPISGLSEQELQSIVWSLMYLTSYLVAGDMGLQEFVNDVGSSLNGSPFDSLTLEQITGRLTRFLEIESLRLRAKAVDLQVDHGRLLQSSRVVTDVRPVFKTGSVADVAGVLVFHSLKLQYYENEETKELFVTLDDRDIIELREDLERAEEKAKTLRALFSDRLHLLDFGSTGDFE